MPFNYCKLSIFLLFWSLVDQYTIWHECIVFDPTSIRILACDSCTEPLIVFFFSMVPLDFFLVFLFYFVRAVVLDQDILFFLWHLPWDWLPSVIKLVYQLLPSLFLKLETSNSASDFSQLLDQHLLGIGLGCTSLGACVEFSRLF